MSKGRTVLKLKTCLKSKEPVEKRLVKPDKARMENYLGITAYDNEVTRDDEFVK